MQAKNRNGAPGEIRTPDLTLRRRSLYPAELRARLIRITHFEDLLLMRILLPDLGLDKERDPAGQVIRTGKWARPEVSHLDW